MSKVVYRTIEVLCELVIGLPIGTNLAVLHLLWTLLSGQLLETRGALFPALGNTGLNLRATRRAVAALAYGQWSVSQLLERWHAVVSREGRWQARRYSGYQALAVDLSAVFRPRLQQC